MQNTLRTSASLGAIGFQCVMMLAGAMLAGGCSSGSPAPAVAAAETLAKAISSAVSAATQPAATTTPAAAAAAASTAINTVGGGSLVGRWILVEERATVSTSVLVFEKNGLFVVATRVNPQTPVVVMKGTFNAGGSTLITKIGPASRTLTYKVRGGQLLLTDPRQHREMVYARR
jgi:hypothetical protein